MNKSIINGIDVSKYFIEVVDEGGSTINYKILPNFERLLVERIFEQNQQLKRLQEENEKLNQELDIKEKMLDKFMIGSGEILEKLQEENEELKKKNNDLIEVIASGNIDIAILQKENEELKKLKKYYKGFVANCKYCDEWYMDKCNYIKKDNKYKQALENIKQFLIFADHSNTGNKYFENVEKALNIANEVLNEQK